MFSTLPSETQCGISALATMLMLRLFSPPYTVTMDLRVDGICEQEAPNVHRFRLSETSDSPNGLRLILLTRLFRWCWQRVDKDSLVKIRRAVQGHCFLDPSS
jgi:hypothetical protein